MFKLLLTRLRRIDPVWVDVVVAAVLFGVSLADILGQRGGPPRFAELCGALSLSAAVAVRRRWMLQATIVLLLVEGAVLVLSGPAAAQAPGGVVGSLSVLLLFYGGGAYLEGWRSLAGLGLGVAICSVHVIVVGSQIAANLLWDDLAIGVLPWFVGRTVREMVARGRLVRERVERLDAEREMHVRVAALAERARLAREIHDVIAHSVSVMVIQAAGARSVMDADPQRAGHALQSVERAGREALAEMRRLLGVLGDGSMLRELAPQPGLDDLDELVARSGEAGVPAKMTVVGEPVSVPPGVGLCAYRVIQEALTNTIKHAGAGQAVVSLRWGADRLAVSVRDDGRLDRAGAVAPRVDGGGHGIVGMRERVALHGGQVVTGPRPDGGFAVEAWIPLPPELTT